MWPPALPASLTSSLSRSGAGPGRLRMTLSVLTPVFGLALFTVCAAALLALAEPGAGWNGHTLAFAAGLALALPVVTWAMVRPGERYLRRLTSQHGRLRPVPAALALAVGMALLSRWAHFVPGYVFGLVIGYVALTDRWQSHVPGPQRVRHEGVAALRGALVVLLVALAAWFGTELLGSPRADDGAWRTVLREALTAVFVMGVEGVVFGLLPIRFLDGDKLLRWSKAAWCAVYVPAAGLFSYVLLTHYRTKVQKDQVHDVMLTMGGLSLAFALFSVSVWCFFHWYGPWMETRTASAQAPQ
jgi:hypothetical protein